VPLQNIPSKGLSWVYLGGRQVLGDAAWGNSKLSKSGKIHCCYQTANAVVIMLATLEGSGQGKKWWHGVRSEDWAIVERLKFAKAELDQSPARNPRPVPPKNGGTRAGHPRE
jgi:hypothetical protein